MLNGYSCCFNVFGRHPSREDDTEIPSTMKHTHARCPAANRMRASAVVIAHQKNICKHNIVGAKPAGTTDMVVEFVVLSDIGSLEAR